MSKRSRTTGPSVPVDPSSPGPRQPCPCGSGLRYKACHGSASGPAAVPPSRPFEGLASECDVIAMRELVPAATAVLPVRDDAVPDPSRTVLLCTLLPMAAPALVRDDGTIWLGLQVQHGYGDPSRDLAAVLIAAYDAAPGSMVGLTTPPGDGPRLQELVLDQALEIEVHEGFDYWVSDVEDTDGSVGAALQQANEAATPTRRLADVEAAYWTNVGTKEHLRWVMPQEEDALLDALARLHHAGRDRLTSDSRLVGMFRAHGRLVPVWDLPVGTGAEALEQPAAAFAAALESALADGSPLSAEERSARAGLANRQVTIR